MAGVLEERLTQIFRLTSRWNAVLLMDEAYQSSALVRRSLR